MVATGMGEGRNDTFLWGWVGGGGVPRSQEVMTFLHVNTRATSYTDRTLHASTIGER